MDALYIYGTAFPQKQWSPLPVWRLTKISFQPQIGIDAAMSQVGAAVNAIRFRMPQESSA